MTYCEATRGSITDQYTVAEKAAYAPDLVCGEVIEVRDVSGLKKYVFMQADDAITAGQFVKLDMAAIGTAAALKATPTAAVADVLLGLPAGAAAVADESYFWCQIFGRASGGTVKTGVAIGDPLTCSATAGALIKQTNTTTAPEMVGAVALEANGSGSDAVKAVFLLGNGFAG